MATPAEVAQQVEQFDDDQWYDFLDRLDEVSRRRRDKVASPDEPSGLDRDEVAAWVAKRHLIADSAIREVWYLPAGAPPAEIRMVEVSDRLGGDEETVDPVDFGLNVEDVPFRLNVADVTSRQWERIAQDPAGLPPGWSLDGGRVWRRRGG